MTTMPTENRTPVDDIPDGLWGKCTKCGAMLYQRELEKDLRVCKQCGFHFRLGARDRIAITADPDSFVEHDAELAPANPLAFPECEEKLARDQRKTGLLDALVWGECALGGVRVALGVADSGFLMASMGSVLGEKVARAMEFAAEQRVPLILFSASGGARMQEGIISLMQMAKTAAAAHRLGEARIPYISVLTDPTTAGVWASYASLGDVIVAEPGALIGFAGPRVIEQNLRIKLPAGSHTAEFQLEHGMVDLIVPRREMKPTLQRLLDFLWSPPADASAENGKASPP
jgi:acetyl-CoA carboxylase carboxyl transferase subunit beta